MKTIYKNRGFTLLELMIVIAIASILAALAVPGWLAWRANSKINGAATNLRGDLEMAKMRAIKENTRVAVLFEAADRYRIFIDDYFVSGGGAEWTYDAGIDPLLRNRQLVPGVTIDLGATTFPNNRTRFNSRGLAENLPGTEGEVRIVDSRGYDRLIKVNMVGRIRLEY